MSAALARNCKRPTDFAARYSGEEFALVLPDTPSEGALMVIESARRDFAALAIVNASPTSNLVTFSAGVATYVPQRDATPQHLLERAEQALYRAKELGRNRAVCAV